MTDDTRRITSTAVVWSFTAGDSARSPMSFSWRRPKSMSCCIVRATPMMAASATSRAVSAALAGSGLGQIRASGSPRTRYAPTRVSNRTTLPAGTAASTARRLICWTQPFSWAPTTSGAPNVVRSGTSIGAPHRSPMRDPYGRPSISARASFWMRSMIRPTYCRRVMRFRYPTIARIDASARAIASTIVTVGACSADVSRPLSASTQNANVVSSRPMSTCPTRSRQNVRKTRGENCPLASCSDTTSRENTTPAVVIVAPAIVDSSVWAASGDMLNVVEPPDGDVLVDDAGDLLQRDARDQQEQRQEQQTFAQAIGQRALAQSPNVWRDAFLGVLHDLVQ